MNQPHINVVDIVTSDQNKKYEPVGRMANAIIEIKRENGGCLPTDLNARGFTPQEVSDWWHMANELATVELKTASKGQPLRPNTSSRR